MTYDAIETGPLGVPVEMYEFAQAGTFTRYTSAATTQTIGAQVYEPLAGLGRSEPIQGNEVDSGEVQITMPSNEPIPQQFRGTIPSNLPLVTIFRKHLNDVDDDVITYFTGTVISCAFAENVATLICQTPTRQFLREVPRAVYSSLCNHQLYDTGCAVLKDDYKLTAGNVSSIDPAGTTLVIDNLRVRAGQIDTALGLGLTSAELDTFWLRGFIETLASPAEFRMIAEGDVGGSPDTVRVNMVFRALIPGQPVNVFAGCPHSLDFCDRKFLNSLRFGGFPYVPEKNPFAIELAGGQTDEPTTTVYPFSGGGSGGGAQRR